jgi:hypothetical protein
MVLHGFLSFMLFVGAQALDSQDGILRPAIAFFLDDELLLPQGVVKRVALLDGGIAVPLGLIHAVTVRELFQQVLDLPFHVGGWFFGAAAKIHVVLDLQPAQLVFEHVEFFVNGQSGSSSPGSGSRRAFTRNIP